ncbi:hypothetical protein FB474_3867 [Oryzihumus leptocrescens]|uniref:Uncharacterized protein n=1 Tax=Oryzihumus leptocrescens TaxID=297536 RepID=A0A542Z9V2_9MICO|nr:hypothetical protein FB474_3867 [Oryzihumus leptocrescens]
MARLGVGLDRQLTIPVDLGTISKSQQWTPLDFAYASPALMLTWRELLVAGLRVGRPSWLAQLSAFWPARLEAVRRVLHLLSHLGEMQFGASAGLVRTRIFDDEDGSEKAFSSYAMGMALCQAYASRVYAMPALAHYDALHGSRGLRPDLVLPWAPKDVFFEAKGRFRRLRNEAMANAVDQLFGHPFASRMKAGVVTAGCFSGPSSRLSMHVRTLMPSQISAYATISALQGRDDASALESFGVTGSYLLGLALTGNFARLTLQELDGAPYLCGVDGQSGLVIGLAASQVPRVWEGVAREMHLDVQGEALFERVASESAIYECRDLAEVSEIAIGWTSDTGVLLAG